MLITFLKLKQVIAKPAAHFLRLPLPWKILALMPSNNQYKKQAKWAITPFRQRYFSVRLNFARGAFRRTQIGDSHKSLNIKTLSPGTQE